MLVLKSNETCILKTKEKRDDLNECYFDNLDFSSFKYIAGLILHKSQCSLIFIDMVNKTFYFVNPLNEKDSNKLYFYEKWR